MRNVITLIFMCIINHTTYPQEQGTMSNEVKSVLTKSIEAYGGSKNLIKLNMCQYQHEVTPYENGKPQLHLRFTSWSNFFGDKRYVDNFTNGTLTSRIVATEKDLWAYDGKGIEVPVPNEIRTDGCKAVRQTYLSNAHNILIDKNITTRLLKNVVLDDVKCQVLEVSCNLIKEKTEVYFDANTGLIVRTSSTSGDSPKAVVAYADYVNFDGHLCPTRIYLYLGDQLVSDNKLRKVKFLDKSEPSIFTK
jgi:hypothetical protein